MLIKGEIKSVKFVRKLDDNRKEITTLDFRVEVKEGDINANTLIDLPGNPAKITIEPAQLKIE